MEARISRMSLREFAPNEFASVLRPFFVCAFCVIVCAPWYQSVAQQSYQAESINFVVRAPDPRLAQEIARKAEVYRKELSLEWLGYEIPQWQERCPIQVEIGMHAGGETSFAFVGSEQGKGTPLSWQMRIFGPPDRLLDAVLPHEITHTIFATHFGRPLPRWADEGACTMVEHASERAKNHRMLIDFLTSKPSRGIPFNRMFVMREYPRDILPLYAQGYSLARFLINQKGKREFVEYVNAGLNSGNGGSEISTWERATKQHYGFENLSELQIDWLAWVKSGCQDSKLPETYAVSNRDKPSQIGAAVAPNTTHNWYVHQSQTHSDGRVATHRQSFPIQSLAGPQSELIQVNQNNAKSSPPPAPPSATIWR